LGKRSEDVTSKFLAAAAALALAIGFTQPAHAQSLYRLTAFVPLGGGIKWDYLHFDAPSGRLYISHGDEVTAVNGNTGRVVGELSGLPGSHGITVDSATGLVYADSADRGLLIAFNPTTFQPVASVPVLVDADGVSYDPASKQIFVSGGDGNGFTPVSTITGKAAQKIDLGSSPEFHVADGAGSLYVDLVDANQIARIDTSTNKIVAQWPTAPCEHPKGLAIDPNTRRLFASCASGVAVVMDADSGRVITALPIGLGTDAARFDPAQHWFLSANGDGTLTVVAEQGRNRFTELGTVKTAPGARTLAVDPRTGRVFEVTARVTKTIPPAAPGDHPHYVFAPGTFSLLILDPTHH
jgi:DNA-binding beta-propeller fold protein YncE